MKRVVIGLICFVGLAIANPVQAQFFSPGKLARPHGNLEGVDNCEKCHDQGKGLSQTLCLDCHKELAPRVAKQQGFHGKMSEEKRSQCQECHPDHRGGDFVMVEWDGTKEKFDHRKAGWPLQGKHAPVKCEGCHQKALVVDASIRQMLAKQPKRESFLGLSTRCATCHFDEHRAQLGNDCQKCHKENDWKPAPGFNHAETSFALKGKHAQVKCEKCHSSIPDENWNVAAFPKPRANSFMQMKPIEHKTCENCHKDPHKGDLGPNCTSCHSEVGWKVIHVGNTQAATFHDKTNFPLRGGHVGVQCKNCHGPFPGQAAKFKGLAFKLCTDCHEDAHIGQLKSAKGVAQDCSVCHTVNAFAPARFEREQHANTKFPLEGGHAAAPCRGCHVLDQRLLKSIPDAVIKKLRARGRPSTFSTATMRPAKTTLECAACHEDVHGGQFKPDEPRFAGKDMCGTCHKTTSFHDVMFDHAKDSRFPLTGAHEKATCGGCHKTEVSKQAGKTFARVRYKPLDVACGKCHADIHHGQFSSEFANKAVPPGMTASRDCDLCHKTSGFKDITFKHDDRRITTFALVGQHEKLKCESCHKPVAFPDHSRAIRYRPLPRTCESCHSDYHHGAFKGFEP